MTEKEKPLRETKVLNIAFCILEVPAEGGDCLRMFEQAVWNYGSKESPNPKSLHKECLENFTDAIRWTPEETSGPLANRVIVKQQL